MTELPTAWLRRVWSTIKGLVLLHRRVTALEEKLERCPGPCCPSCGKPEFRVADIVHREKRIASATRRYKAYKHVCGECGFTDTLAKPLQYGRPYE